MNHMIHIAAVTQLRLDIDGRAYYQRKRAEGKKPMERCAAGNAASLMPATASSSPTHAPPQRPWTRSAVRSAPIAE